MPERMPSILEKIIGKKRESLEQAKIRRPLKELKARIRELPGTLDFKEAIGNVNKVNIIAEIKRKSPSKGVIRRRFDLFEILKGYEDGGAEALSVLTEEHFFGGSLEYIRQIRRLTEKPILRKDFIFEPYQVYEAREAGADALLLIAAALPGKLLQELLGLAGELGLAALVEIHSGSELKAVLETSAEIIGINNRNLHTFEVNPDLTTEMKKQIPEGYLLVSESGLASPADIRRLVIAGIYTFLIGEHFMRSSDIGAAVRKMKEAI